ncbi:hypothetical protein [Brumimicrobium mesophilum]|uniref:hypothetical protein n=1 Tax=Brumimicrobium mesophilum TaxID=392717 RepID=UPI000D143C04|nr:hypothetical protein [Brumimicrobium mesophilum]
MKTLIYIATIIFLSTIAFGCRDKDKEYTIEGRLMLDCETPASNVSGISMKQNVSLGIKKGMIIYFETDEDGYFEVKYLGGDGTNSDFKILKNGEILRDIPVFQDIDLGNVYFSLPRFDFVVKLEVENAYSNLDTLFYQDCNYPQNGADFWMKKIAGPFESIIIDTMWNCKMMSSYSYGKEPLMEVSYYINDYQTNSQKTNFQLSDLCSNKLYEATINLD